MFTAATGTVAQSGDVSLHVVAVGGGAVALTPHGSGNALLFPDRCRSRRNACRVIVESQPDPAALNPGGRPFSFGAAVRITAGQVRRGANVLQKGLRQSPAQYKLQVDAGRPSCVLIGVGDHRAYIARGRTAVADGAWHTVVCQRLAAALVLTVDGAEAARRPIPPALTVANSSPLRLGGKHTAVGNDQYVGDLDNPFVTIPAAR
ncbi:hypothetical protein F4553_007738 [Allocatelliglobosispora scoriae]|uniref:Laminin G domain-containing protein n=1 Tax=Allocatelliglobosispora scoriae TaxID=643052 RepID=A0A841C1S2_9ACTN|nr:LamG domain-containing protein [Allocatelliglobosispora scoriae]MBB5874304.1 hypothetical protein [Allocatelliglobosispora scoriae]